MPTTVTDREEAVRILKGLLGDDLPEFIEGVRNNPEAVTTTEQLYLRVCVILTHRSDCWRRITELTWVAFFSRS